MADFTTHVALHGADDSHYGALEAAMNGANFASVMRSAHGFEYRMPRGLFYSQSFNMTAADVRNLAMNAARGIGLPYDIVTTSGEVSYFLHPTG